MSTQCPIETYLRLRPRDNDGSSTEYTLREAELRDGSTRGLFELSIPPDAAPGLVHNNTSGKVSYEFDAIFNEEATQEDVFEVIARDKVENLMNGENSTIFAYGQTGSGKTYSIFGGDSFQERGIIPRTLGAIFHLRQQQIDAGGSKVTLRLSFTEVYGEVVYDLLDSQKRFLSMEQWSPVQVLEVKGELLLRNLNVYEVDNEEDALSLFFMGNTNRITSATPMNEASSRSHAIFTVMVEHEVQLEEGDTMVCSGKLNLVDLAGSERVYKQANTRASMKEGRNINLSLHYLEQVIVRLRDLSKSGGGGNRNHSTVSNGSDNGSGSVEVANNQHVPYRNSILTSILRDALGGNCRSAFILNVSIDRAFFDETVSTCRFGQRCGEVKVKVRRNAELDYESQIRQLQAHVAALKKDKEDMARTNQSLLDRILPRELSEEEIQVCRSIVYDLLQGAKPTPGEDHGTTSDRLTRSTAAFAKSMASLDHAAVLDVSMSLAAQLQRALIKGLPGASPGVGQGSSRLDRSPHSTNGGQDKGGSGGDSGGKSATRGKKDRDGEKLQSNETGSHMAGGDAAASPDMHRHGPGIGGTAAMIPMAMPPPGHSKDGGKSSASPLNVYTETPPRALESTQMSLIVPELTRAQERMLTEGATFLKHGRMGTKALRVVYVTSDLSSIAWRQEGSLQSNTLTINSFQSVSTGVQGKRDRCLVALVGKPGFRSLFLDYAQHADDNQQNHKMAVLWTTALSVLIKHYPSKPQGNLG